MTALYVGWVAGVLTLAGCASTDVAQKDTLNEPSNRLAALEDRRPPNPNRPNDSRDLQAIPTVVQHDPALNKPAAAKGKDVAVTAGNDSLVRPQDPTVTELTPKAAGAPALATERATFSKADNELATRVKDAIQQTNTKTDPALRNRASNGEGKVFPNLEIKAKSGEVILSGSVGSETERTAIEQAVIGVQGVTVVVNQITVSKIEKQ
jgi:hypothetical protein